MYDRKDKRMGASHGNWKSNYLKLLKYKSINGVDWQHLLKKDVAHPLHKWYLNQRSKKKQLSPKALFMLEQMGFDFENPEKKVGNKWMESYEKLIALKLEYPVTWQQKFIEPGIPNKMYPWCLYQRKNRNSIPQDHKDMLDDIEFSWKNESKSRNAERNVYWAQKYEELRSFLNNNNGNYNLLLENPELNNILKWCKRQISDKGKLEKHRTDKLNNINFPWKMLTVEPLYVWEKFYDEFKVFAEANPGEMPRSKINGKPNSLYGWCQSQKKDKNNLPAERIEKLNNAGFLWEDPTNEKKWEQKFLEFIEFRKSNPVEMPANKISGKSNPLYSWCLDQRKSKATLSEDKISRLNNAGFIWEKETSPQPDWEIMFNEFVNFKKANPYGMPKSKTGKKINPLYLWCLAQKKNKASLPADKIKKLEDAGFIWDSKSAAGASTFDLRIKELEAFTRENPGKMPPFKINGKANHLYFWYKKQQKNRDSLTHEMIEQLNNAGFIWDYTENSLSYFKKWNTICIDFAEFRKENPVGMPKSKVEGKVNSLYHWCYAQQKNKNKLSEEQISKLNSLNFEWSVIPHSDDSDWEKNYESLLEYLSQNNGQFNKNCVPDSIYAWCREQHKNKGKLSDERKLKLEKAEIDWSRFDDDKNSMWNDNYNLLLNYLNKNDGIILRNSVDPVRRKLIYWYYNQQQRKSNFSQERAEKFKLIEIIWQKNVNTKISDWQKNYEETLNFINENKRFPLSIDEGNYYKLYTWLQKQKRNKSKLTQEQKDNLNQIGFSWDKTTIFSTWEEGFDKLTEYRKNNPGKWPLSESKQSAILEIWCNQQRNIKNNLLPLQIDKLKSIGFDFNPFNRKLIEKWNQQFFKVKEFINTYLRFPVRGVSGGEGALGEWCYNQRRKKIKLTPEQIDKLNSLNFCWEQDATDLGRWNEKYEELSAFLKSNNGIFPGRRSEKEEYRLYMWVLKQRKNKIKLNDEQIEKLNKINISWNNHKGANAQLWEAYFDKFVELRKISPGWYPKQISNGIYNPLYGWIRKNRLNKNKLSPEKIEKLNQIGFDWELPKKEILLTWDNNYNKLIDLLKEDPDIWSKIETEEKFADLKKWCFIQRRNRSRLQGNRKERLSEIGFPWQIKSSQDEENNKRWNSMFDELKKFREVNPGKWPESRTEGRKANKLYDWMSRQRRNKNLSENRKILLDSIGFQWASANAKSGKWFERYNELVEYINAKRSEEAPAMEKPAELAEWCSEQRNNKERLSAEQTELLNKINFRWDPVQEKINFS